MLGADCQVLEVVEVGDDHLKSWIVDRIGRGAERSDSFNVAIVRQLLKDGVSFGGAPDKGVESGLLALTVMIARLTASCAADLRVETTEAHHGDHEGPDAEHELDVVSIHPADRTPPWCQASQWHLRLHMLAGGGVCVRGLAGARSSPRTHQAALQVVPRRKSSARTRRLGPD